MRDIGSLPGSFAKKHIKGRDYWYYQFTDLNGESKQVYVGADSDRIREMVERSKQPHSDAHIKQVIEEAIKSGCSTMPVKQFNIVRRLADYGFFAAGGVLAGTHAFNAIGNALGVKWMGSDSTRDVDFAHAGKSIAIALPSNIKPNLHSAIESLEMGFVPMTAFDACHAASYVNPQATDERIDFLTPVTGLSSAPVFIKELGVALQPLKFMELSLSMVDRSVVISSSGSRATVVNIPHPPVFAVHKLIVAAERGAANIKSAKDVMQAASIMDFYLAHDKDALREAWKDAQGRGAGWEKRMNQGLERMRHIYPEIQEQVQRLVGADREKRRLNTEKSPSPALPGKAYYGEIVDMPNNDTLIQQVGRSGLIVHAKQNLDRVIEVGEEVKITYDEHGKGKVVPRENAQDVSVER